MRKLVRTIALIMIAFFATSLLIYRMRIERTLPGSLHSRMASEAEVKTATGEISEVNEDNGTLVLNDDDRTLVIIFDDSTAITDLDGESSSSSITTGIEAMVRYTERDGTKRAKSIMLARHKRAEIRQ